MQIKEEKICSFTQKGKRIQLLKITELEYDPNSPVFKENPELNKTIYKYQVRINRKIKNSYAWEGEAKRRMANYITEELLQQKFSF